MTDPPVEVWRIWRGHAPIHFQRPAARIRWPAGSQRVPQTRPDSTAGTRQAGWIKPPLVDRPVDRGRGDHQSRPFDRDPARDPPGRPMLPHDKTPHKPRPSLAVEAPGPHAGNPSGLAATLGGRCTMAPPRANGERVSGHLPADGRFVPARRSGHPAAASPPRASATRFPRARPRQDGRTGPWDLPIPGCRRQTPSYREPMGPHHPQALHQQRKFKTQKRRNSSEIAAFAKSRLLLARFLRPLTDALSRHLAPSAIARPEICRQTHPCHSGFPNPQASFTPLHGQRQVTTRHMKRHPRIRPES